MTIGIRLLAILASGCVACTPQRTARPGRQRSRPSTRPGRFVGEAGTATTHRSRSRENPASDSVRKVRLGKLLGPEKAFLVSKRVQIPCTPGGTTPPSGEWTLLSAACLHHELRQSCPIRRRCAKTEQADTDPVGRRPDRSLQGNALRLRARPIAGAAESPLGCLPLTRCRLLKLRWMLAGVIMFSPPNSHQD